jgi:hypothetical protein
MKFRGLQTKVVYTCDACGNQFKEPCIHIAGVDFCSWPCCHSEKGQEILRPFTSQFNKK